MGSAVDTAAVEEHWHDGVCWRSRGEGPDVVLLHGIGSSSGAFEPQLADLSRDHRVHAWDAPGYGRSADVEVDLSTEDYVARVVAYLEQVGVVGHGVHLVGVSWGGVLAIGVALALGGCAGLTLVSSSVGGGTDPDRRAAVLRRLDDFDERGLDDVVRDRVPKLLSDHAPAELHRSVAALMRSSIRPGGYHSALRAMAATDWRDRLGEVALPTLVCVGSADQVTGARQGLVLHHGIEGSAYVPVPRAGHLLNQERPRVTNALLRTFFEMVGTTR